MINYQFLRASDQTELRKEYDRHCRSCMFEGIEPCTYAEYIDDPHLYTDSPDLSVGE